MAPPFSDEVQGWAPELGAALQAELGETGEFDPHSLVVRGAYAERGGAVYGEAEMPRSGDLETDAYFDERLGPDDAVLIIARGTVPGMLRARRRSSPPHRRA